jgi:ATP-dependent Clp protease ATP-binding subunit ClpA
MMSGSSIRTIVELARAEARTAGSSTIEAEHVLLALASQRGTAARGLLASVGLDHEAIDAALLREFEQSLAAAGISVSAASLPPPRRDPRRPVHIGASTKLVLHRAIKAAGGRRLEPEHVLVGIVDAQVGTVSRALAVAGIDRAELAARARRALTPADG